MPAVLLSDRTRPHVWTVQQLVREVRGYRPTIVHAHLFYATLCVATTRVITRAPKRIVTFHNLGYDSYPINSRGRRVRHAIDRVATTRGFDGWIGVSDAVSRHYTSWLGLPDVWTIRNAVDAETLRRQARENAGAEKRLLHAEAADGTIVCIGRFRREKGHRVLVAAVDRLRREGISPVVVFAGEGPLEREVAADVHARGLASNFRFLGHLSHVRLAGVIAAADLVVAPSLHEGLGVAIAESLAVGKPVIASRVGGIPELIRDGETGLLCPPGDAHALARRIRELLQDREQARRLGAAGAISIESLCGLENVVRAHERLFAAVERG